VLSGVPGGFRHSGTRRGSGIRSHPVSLVRRVCHGRNNSVSPTGTSDTTPQEMVYTEFVCMGDTIHDVLSETSQSPVGDVTSLEGEQIHKHVYVIVS
jgi:hypothetical protein